jgi:type IV secretory pathway ATPase VirB11/archaellum biosynthesis ATPase
MLQFQNICSFGKYSILNLKIREIPPDYKILVIVFQNLLFLPKETRKNNTASV